MAKHVGKLLRGRAFLCSAARVETATLAFSVPMSTRGTITPVPVPLRLLLSVTRQGRPRAFLYLGRLWRGRDRRLEEVF